MPTSHPRAPRRSRRSAAPLTQRTWAIVARGPARPAYALERRDAWRWERCVIAREGLAPPLGFSEGTWRFVAAIEPDGAEWAACSAPLAGEGSYVDPDVRAVFDDLTRQLTADGWNLVRAALGPEPWHAWRFRRRRFSRRV